jgi:hypothetical protein
MKSNSIATISIVIASSWFARWPSGDSCRSRRTLCRPCGMPENATCMPSTSKSVCPACSRVNPSRIPGVATIGAPGT